MREQRVVSDDWHIENKDNNEELSDTYLSTSAVQNAQFKGRQLSQDKTGR